VSGDDDDGHAAGGALVTTEQIEEIRLLFDAAKGIDSFNVKAFYGWLGTDDLAMIPAARFADVCAALKRKIGGAK
jgi:hypothetical protein